VQLTINNLANIEDAAKKFLEINSGKKIFAFYGEMGAGKTTFIKALCAGLRSVDVVTSPTFTLVNEYLTEDGDYLYHFDFYRIKKLEEAYDFGFEEYLDSGKFCFIEWPEKVEDLLPPSICNVRIKVNNDSGRTLDF
jgi:tRNA threonylcarbamoyladenosine biosynthesis protein TsaE